jgi:FtsP/CotA-like multicopper oxidase with cupredoxin domain
VRRAGADDRPHGAAVRVDCHILDHEDAGMMATVDVQS